jgi:sorting nexin-1/2
VVWPFSILIGGDTVLQTNIKHFKSCEMYTIRRFSDFLGLHEKLVAKYQSRGIIVPPPPEKSVIGR